MKQIDEFVDSVYQGVEGNQNEIQELKAEMKSHLLETVQELKADGKSEDEAIEVAIERFGGEQEIRSVIGQLFITQKLFAKRVLYTAVTFLVLSLITWGVLWVNDVKNRNLNANTVESILSTVKNKEVISEDTKEEITRLVKNTNQFSKVKIINAGVAYKQEVEGDSPFSFEKYIKETKPDYEYKREVWSPEWLLPKFQTEGFGQGNNDWFVTIERRNFDTLIALSGIVGVVVYATLFTIWATINAYHHRRLRAGWILVFALLNVLGYLAYHFVEVKFRSNTVS